jgi:NFU1 iron-sulfur cluster scaffold homolog, mitochondrial
MSFRVLEIQPTPNPNAAKFVLDRAVADQPTSFFNAGAAQGHALAEKLFAIPGVSSLLLLGDFITVNKTPETRWDEISPRVKAILAAKS